MALEVMEKMHQSNPLAATTDEVAAMDTFYISHGSPTLSIDDSLPARHFLKSWVPAGLAGAGSPRAILVVSGHWETDTPAVNVITGANSTLQDFYGFPEQTYDLSYPAPVAPDVAMRAKKLLEDTGFPEQMYDLSYPAPGAPDVAMRAKKLLEDAGLGPVTEDHRRGLDHGAWVPLMLMYPAADVPVFQLSVQTGRDAAYHYELGRALAPLREEDDVLIIGSGSATHNLRKILPTFAPTSQEPVQPWAAEFDAWLRDSLLDGRHDDIKRYEEKAPYAKVAHPQPDHLYPLHVALGAAGEKAKAELIHQSWSNGTLSYASYRFTTKH